MAICVGMASLGCPKNQVDGELLLAKLEGAGFLLSSNLEQCDVVLVNTCGFVQSAKEEAIEQIFELVALKQEGKLQKIVVTGCLAERYRTELLEEIPEVDVVVGIGSNAQIVEIVTKAMNPVSEGEPAQRSYFAEKEYLPLAGERQLSTPSGYAYLKVAEGCDNHCSYCAIPAIRGKFRSRPIEDLLEEAAWIASQGVRELVLIAQDTTRYGEDLYGTYRLPDLLKKLCAIEGFRWIRLLYCYPDKITDELIATIAEQEKIVNYLDVPLQHANDEILKKMNRPFGKEQTVELIRKLRREIPGVTLRTTLIAGFPTETEAQFEELCLFVREMKFDHLGCFAYSEEEGTPAATLPQLPEEVRARRAELIMEEQMMVLDQRNEEALGRTVTVLVEGYDRLLSCYFGRTPGDAPEIDGKIFFTVPTTSKQDTSPTIPAGEFVSVRLTERYDYDLLGELVTDPTPS